MPWNIKNPNGEMRERVSGEVHYLSFSAFEALPEFRHCFSTRQGGVSEGFLSTMNFSFDRGDDPAHVTENYRRIAAAIGAAPDSFVVGKQTHTTNIHVVRPEDRGKGVTRPRNWTDIDGLMTNVPGITLVTFHADCIPVWFADPVQKAVCLVHAGWKGTVNGIAVNAVRLMRENYGTDPGDLVTAVGPGICGDCYETGEECAEAFKAAFPEKEVKEILTRPHVGADGKLHWQLDLLKANRFLLLREGVPAEQIHLSDICTRCNPDRLFSHRAQGVRRGLNAAFLGIRE